MRKKNESVGLESKTSVRQNEKERALILTVTSTLDLLCTKVTHVS